MLAVRAATAIMNLTVCYIRVCAYISGRASVNCIPGEVKRSRQNKERASERERERAETRADGDV